MKKKLALAFAMLFMGSMAQADDSLSATFIGSSNYIFRAMSYNSQGAVHQGQGSPVIEASVDYLHTLKSNTSFGASFFSGPADTFNTQAFIMEKDTEADTFLSLSQQITDNLSITAGYNYYSFMKNVDNDMGEVAGSITYRKLKLSNGYTDRFSGVDTNQNRTLLTFTPELYRGTSNTNTNWNGNVSLDLRIARDFFSNPVAVATSSYYDYLAGFVIGAEGFSVEVAYTNTLDRTNLITNELAKNTDGTFTVSFSKTLQAF